MFGLIKKIIIGLLPSVATGVDTLNFDKKVDLASLKSDIDKLNIANLEKVRTSLNILKSKVHKLDVEN